MKLTLLITNKFNTEAPISCTIETAPSISDCSRAQCFAMCAWHSVLYGSANVYSVCCRCDFAVQCHGSSHGARSSRRQQVGPSIVSTLTLFQRDSVAAAGFCFVDRCERSSPTRWFSDKRLCDNSGNRKVVRTWSRRQCQRDGVAKIAGSNNGETQALAFANESLRLARLAWSEKDGASIRRWNLDETVRQVGGMLITDSRYL